MISIKTMVIRYKHKSFFIFNLFKIFKTHIQNRRRKNKKLKNINILMMEINNKNNDNTKIELLLKIQINLFASLHRYHQCSLRQNIVFSRLSFIIFMDNNIDKQIGLRVERVLGKGSFATVYYCVDKLNQNPCAVKVFRKKDFTKSKLRCFTKQAEILASINHKNVVRFSSFHQTESSLYLIMQYIPGCTLKQLITRYHQQNKRFSDGEVATIMKSILEGIQYLHRLNIIHRDLKTENVLIADPGNFSSVKIVDFGLSAQMEAGSPSNVKSQCGTLLYMAPQILHQPSYSKSVDIWSCAIIMYILYTGKHPIYEQGMKTEIFRQKLKSCSFPSLNNSLANNFIQNISKIQYTQRYSVNEALRHPWITRNQQDQIPLSINQSMHSFNTSHLISDTFKFLLCLGQIRNYQIQVPKQYKKKLQNFNQKHQQCRIRSPSYKKNRIKNQINQIKIKQILNSKQKQREQQKQQQYLDLDSPVIKKHEKLFLRLFDRNKQQAPQLLQLQRCKQEQPIIQNEMVSPSLSGSKRQFREYLTEQLKPSFNSVQIDAEQMFSPISISCKSINSARENTDYISSCNVDLPLIKIASDKKQKLSIEPIKLNSLREDLNKNQHNYSFFKGYVLKNSKEKIKDTTTVSNKSKRLSHKFQPFSPQIFTKNSNKKPQTAQRGKTTNKTKQYRPMVFGIRGTHS